MNNAVIYARYSSVGQNEQSIDGQVRICKEFAESRGLSVVKIYNDKARTGTNDNRPDFQRMIADAESGAFQHIIVYKFDRFARNRIDSIMYKARLKKEQGIRVISATEPVSDDEGGEIYEMFLEWNDEKYSERLSKRIRDGLVTALENGTYTGGTKLLYGFKLIPTDKTGKKGVINKIGIHDEHGDVVRYIFDEYANGTGKAEIVDALNKQGHKYFGKPFHIRVFETMLSNTKYKGEMTRFDRVWTNVFPAIVDPITFDKVQERLKDNQILSGANSAVEPYILTGKAHCKLCTTMMVSDGGTGRTGVKHYYYACKQKKKDKCIKKRNRKDNIEKAVASFVVLSLRDPEVAERASSDSINYYEQRTGDDGLRSIETRIQRANQEVEQATQTFMSARNELLKASIEKKMDELEVYLKDLEKERAKIKLERTLKVTKDQIKAFIAELVKGDLNNKAFQKKIIDNLVYRVWIGDGHFGIALTFFDINKTETVTLADIDDAIAKLKGVLAVLCVQTLHAKLHQTCLHPNQERRFYGIRRNFSRRFSRT